MGKEGVHKIAKVIRDVARIVLLVLAVLIFVFSLLSGAESLGGGMKGIVNNFPNTIPWIFLIDCCFYYFQMGTSRWANYFNHRHIYHFLFQCTGKPFCSFCYLNSINSAGKIAYHCLVS